MIATGIASGILQGMAIKMFSFVAPSLLSIPLFVNPDGSSGNLTGILICILIAVILAFVITYLVIKKEKAKDKGVVFWKEPLINLRRHCAPDSGQRKLLDLPKNNLEIIQYELTFIPTMVNGEVLLPRKMRSMWLTNLYINVK
jgi:hypothetical protein